MGVDFSAYIMIGETVKVSDLLYDEGELQCKRHGKHAGSFCDECGDRLKSEYLPTELAQKLQEMNGIDPTRGWYGLFEEDSPTGEALELEVLSYRHSPEEWDWSDEVIIGIKMGYTGSHRAGYPIATLHLAYIKGNAEIAASKLKALGLSGKVKLYVLGNVG